MSIRVYTEISFSPSPRQMFHLWNCLRRPMHSWTLSTCSSPAVCTTSAKRSGRWSTEPSTFAESENGSSSALLSAMSLFGMTWPTRMHALGDIRTLHMVRVFTKKHYPFRSSWKCVLCAVTKRRRGEIVSSVLRSFLHFSNSPKVLIRFPLGSYKVPIRFL